ncbi:hypothetical protein BN140_1712 [Methanoculleus bourgensis MS2]|uniref:Pyrrolo-quinoline quinone repeat domain-containing protein n=2 Tax=Methanoculleus bourgensis TaxID=83986 RepID=I7L029_METBM|nr:hypothetical protein BN140_1712 [Methanoculleus bourgensis MS2]
MFFACRTTPIIDSMTGRNRYFRSSPIRVIIAALLIVALLPAAAVSAAENAPTVTWNVTFSPEENSKFDAVANTADGGYIALGSTLTEVYGGNEDLLLVKTDARGNETWTVRIPGMVPASVAEIADGGYIIGGYNVSTTVEDQNFVYQGTSFLIRTDADGKEIWRQVLPGEKVSAVRPTADGGYAVIGWLWSRSGSADDTTAVITKTDADGTPAWNRTFPGISANAGVVTTDGGYIIGGTTSPFNNDIGDAFLIRLDADGNTIWHKNYQAPVVYDVEETADGGFVYSGNFWYGLVDAKGDEVWLRNMEGLAGHAVLLRPAGGYVIAGKDIRSGEGFALGTDADGAVQWRTTLPDTGVYAAAGAPDGGYTLAGIRFLSPVSSAAWLANLEETATPTPATPGFGAAVAGAALLLIAGRRRRG